VVEKPGKQAKDRSFEKETEGEDEPTSETVSRMGPISLQGPHQAAQKPTSTGRSEARTSSENVSWLIVLTLHEISILPGLILLLLLLLLARSAREGKERGIFFPLTILVRVKAFH
jgi:hypothetical protein